MMQVPFSNIVQQNFLLKDEISSAIERVLSSGRFISGLEVERFEEEFSTYIGSKYAVGVSSGTDALILALKACKIKPGDNVITSPMSFFATVEAIEQCNATPVFVDIDLDTYNIFEEDIERNINDRTKAIIVVHLHGRPVNMDVVNTIGKKYGLWVIEDAAQAHGSLYKNKKAGSLGDIGCFSFFPGKNLGALGDAGIVTTNNTDFATSIKMLRNHGRNNKYFHTEIGFNSRMDELQAAILRIKLKYLDAWNGRRREIAKIYTNELKCELLKIPTHSVETQSNWHQFAVYVKRREEVSDFLHSIGITTGTHYPVPLHLQPALEHLGYEVGNFPNAECFAKHTLSLPIYPELDNQRLDYVISQINEYV